MRCSSEAWVGGMGWCCWWNWTTSDDDDDDTRFASRLPSFPCLLLLFSSILLLVYSYRVSQSLSLSLALSRFFLSIFEFFFSFFGEGEFFLHARCVLCGFASACFPYAWRVGGVLKEGGGSTTRRLLPDGGEDDEDDGLAEAMTRKMNHCERSLRLSSTGNSCDSWLWWSWNSRHTPVSPNSGSS